MRKILTPEAFDQETADAVVIGGGIIGVATAFWLSRAGLSTVLVEMRDGLSTLTTTASIESFRAQFTEPAMAALAKGVHRGVGELLPRPPAWKATKSTCTMAATCF